MIDTPAPETIVAANVPPVTVTTKCFVLLRVRYGPGSSSWKAHGWGRDTPEQAQILAQSLMMIGTFDAWRIIRVDGLPVDAPHPESDLTLQILG